MPAKTDTAKIFINVQRLSPLAVDDDVEVNEDEPITIHVRENDLFEADYKNGSLQIITSVSNGSIEIVENTSETFAFILFNCAISLFNL